MSLVGLEQGLVASKISLFEETFNRINDEFKVWINAKKTDMISHRCSANFSITVIAVKWSKDDLRKTFRRECTLRSPLIGTTVFYKSTKNIKVTKPDSIKNIDFLKELKKVEEFLNDIDSSFALKVCLESSFSVGIGFSSQTRKIIHAIDRSFEEVDGKLEEMNSCFFR